MKCHSKVKSWTHIVHDRRSLSASVFLSSGNVFVSLGVLQPTTRAGKIASMSRPVGYWVDPVSRPGSIFSLQIHYFKSFASPILTQLHCGTANSNDFHIFVHFHLFQVI